MSGFKKFLLRGNLVDLAVAVVIGAAFNDIVKALVADLFTPLIAAVGGKHDFSALIFTINGSKFAYGHFINVLISFLIIATVVYFLVVVPFSRLLERFRPEPAQPAPTQSCPHCLSSVPAQASVCAFCTRDISLPVPG